MREEVQCGCEFIAKLLIQRHLPVQFAKPFKRRMEELLTERYKDHWDPSNPNQGSAYRCIRINGNRLDPVVKEAAKVTGLTNISEYLPSQLTLWIDPSDVSYRFGEDGSICSCTLESHKQSVSHYSTYGASSFRAPTTTQLSPVVSRTASPSPVKRSTSTPVKHRSITPPSVARSISPPHTSGSSYYMNQLHDSYPRMDYVIPVHV